MPERRAASGLAPVAYSRLPAEVRSITYHMINCDHRKNVDRQLQSEDLVVSDLLEAG